jgi:DNA repair protein RecN (Recombination protein N)
VQIQDITIRNLGVIEAVELRIAPGFTVITGETGAGKTMLVTALQLALGARADQQLVRDGAEKATIDVVCVQMDANDLLDGDTDETIVTREILAQGRAVARLNGRPVPVATVEELFRAHVGIHAQHTHMRLSRADTQRDLLDRYAGDEHQQHVSRYAATYDTYQQLSRRYEAREASAVERVREHARLQFEVEEIEAAAIVLPDDQQLDEQIARLAHADQLADAARRASVLLDADHGANAIGDALQQLKAVRDVDPQLAATADTLAGLAEEVVLVSRELRSYAEALDTDPTALAVLQERKQQLAGLCRKYGPTLDDVVAYEAQARDTLARFDADDLQTLTVQRDDAFAAMEAAAEVVRTGRKRAAIALADDVQAHLADLGMPYATFTVTVTEAGAHRHGMDEVLFLLAANPGEPAVSIADAVSGGERSRVALAIEVALADVDDADVLVFDEVDAGIGGKTALAVGEKLARLADGSNGRKRQVMCVTHLAQLAVFADRHYVVEKQVRDGRTHTAVRAVADDDREHELSRLLGGVVAQEGVEHARVLIETARARLTGQK